MLSHASVMLLMFLSPFSVIGTNSNSLMIDYASARTFPEADCSKIHIYVRNQGDSQVLIKGIRVRDQEVDLDEAIRPPDGPEIKTSEGEDGSIGKKTNGIIQWARAIPNPVPAGKTCEVGISLWGTEQSDTVEISLDNGSKLNWCVKYEEERLRISQIAFDPRVREKLYVYCENVGQEDIEIGELSVDANQVEFKSLPSTKKIPVGSKTSLIGSMRKAPEPSVYSYVSVSGTRGERAGGFVRAINLFSVGAWGGDKRKELFFDPVDLERKREGLQGNAFRTGVDPTCIGNSYEDNARNMIRDMAHLLRAYPDVPVMGQLCKPDVEAYGFFGEIPDASLVSPFSTLFRAPFNPLANAEFLREARRWVDPKPIIHMTETFTEAGRNLTPEEVSFLIWDGIGEGAKGVRYYTQKGNPRDVRGYSQMAGIEKLLARENLNLQILRAFLAVGDTFADATTVDGGITPKTILCGDKGIVLILMAPPKLTGEDKSAPCWEQTTGTTARIRRNLCKGVRSVYVVDGGLKLVPHRIDDGDVVLDVPPCHVRQIYLLCSEKAEITSDGDKFRGMNATGATAKYKQEIYQRAGPLMEAALSSAEIIPRAVDLGAIRAECTGVLRSQEESLNADDVLGVAALAQAWLDIGDFVESERISIAAIQNTQEHNRVKLCRALAGLHGIYGEYWEAAQIYMSAYDLAQDPEARFVIAGYCSGLFEKDILDLGKAAEWAVAQVRAGKASSPEVAQARHRAAVLLLKMENSLLAVEMLEGIDVAHADGLHIDSLKAEAYMKLGRRADAIKSFERAVLSEPDRAAKSRYMVAQLFLSEGKYGDARMTLLELVKSDPEDPFAKKAADILSRISE